jgi:NitT/TauT family transport system permease protein
MKSPTSRLLFDRAATLAPLAFVLLAWQLVAHFYPQTQFFFSSPAKVIQALWSMTLSLELFRHAGVTVFEAIAGFVIGTTSGALIGLSLWYSPFVARISRPYVIAIGAVPVFALAPVMIVWFGIGIFSKIMIAALSTVVVAIVQAYEGATSVDSRHLQLLRVMGATRYQTFRKVVVPSALIWVVNSMKLNVGFALLGAFIGEFISSEQGLGYLIVRAAGLYDMSRVFAGILAIMAIALALSALVSRLEARLFAWRTAQ